MYGSLKEHLSTELRRIEAEGLTKRERVITSQQAGRIDAVPGGRVLTRISQIPRLSTDPLR